MKVRKKFFLEVEKILKQILECLTAKEKLGFKGHSVLAWQTQGGHSSLCALPSPFLPYLPMEPVGEPWEAAWCDGRTRATKWLLVSSRIFHKVLSFVCFMKHRLSELPPSQRAGED